jgi:hypothetical protein
MWSIAVAVNSFIWTVLGVFLIYSTGMLVLHGAWRQFLFALVLWLLSIVSEMIVTALDS